MKPQGPLTILKKPIIGPLPAVAAWCEEYKRHAFPRFELTTQSIVELELRRFALFMGHREISGQLIYEFMDLQFKRTSEPQTLHKTVLWVGKFLRYCEDVGHLNKRYSTLLTPIKLVQKDPEMFTPEQYEKMKEASKGTMWHYATILAYRTGARLSDVCLMQWKSVDLDNLYISYVPWKSRKTGRKANCPFQAGGDLHEVLKEMVHSRSQLPHWDQFVCPELAMRYPVYGPAAYGGSSMVGAGFKALCIKIGAPHLSFHKLRNSFFSRAVNSGVAFAQISQMSGLATFSVLLRYAKPDLPVLRAAMERIELVDAGPPADGKILALPAPPAA